MSESLVIDDLTFEVQRSARRKTIDIVVDRDGRLLAMVPADCPHDLLERAAREKQPWVFRKLQEKEALCQPVRPKEYVSGEGFHYLGRSYRLLLLDPAPGDGQSLPLSLGGGRFMLRRDQHDRAAEIFVEWYEDHGRPWILHRVNLLGDRLGVAPATVEVRDLGFRWASCGSRGDLAFHWRVILLPPRIVEYVVAHELVHLLIPDHGPRFWSRLESAMPDYAARKQWLAENGARFG